MKILVALDGSKFAEAVISPTAELAVQAKAEVFLVQVVEPSKVHGTWSGSTESYEEAIRERMDPWNLWPGETTRETSTPKVVEIFEQALERAVQDARDYLRHVASRFVPLRPEVVVLVGDDVDEELAKFAGEHCVDLIAMATHGRTGLARLLLGSHAGNMLRRRIAPVMIVRPDGLHKEEEP